MAEIHIRIDDNGNARVTDIEGKELEPSWTVNPREPVQIKEGARFCAGNVQWWGGSPICVQHGDSVF